MLIAQGHLTLFARRAAPHHPIDHFFRSLAEEQRHMAIGVVLSGTATDGTLGLEEIKAGGGITFAQDDTAQHDGMPRSAVASGAVDFVLPPEGIAEEIARIAAHPFVAPGPQDARAAARGPAPGKTEVAPVLRHLRAATGADFTQYKASTLVRRIIRRMVLLKKDGIGAYADHLRAHPGEAESLFQDILINVTSFFRDAEMFQVLKARVVPALLRNRSPDDPLRVWVPGCSTGEEAYSVAMVLLEGLEVSNVSPRPRSSPPT
jgi:two-component system CheB/CheR fusion protein